MAGAGLLSLLPQASAMGGLGLAKIALDGTQSHFARSTEKSNQEVRLEQARTQAAQDEADRQQALSKMLARQRALMGGQGVQASGSALQGLDTTAADHRPRAFNRSLLNLNKPSVDSAWLDTAFRVAGEYK